MKRAYSILFIITIIMVSICFSKSVSYSANSSESMDKAYQYIKDKNFKWLHGESIECFDTNLWEKYQILAIKKPMESIKQVVKVSTAGGYHTKEIRNSMGDNGEWRFIGVSPQGEAINNPNYPYDYKGEYNIEKYDYNLGNGSKDKDIRYVYPDLERRQEIENEIFAKLDEKFGYNSQGEDRFVIPKTATEIDKWLERASLLIMPTPTSYGMVRFTHNTGPHGSTGPFYFTVILDPLGGGEIIRPPDSSTTEVEVAPITNRPALRVWSNKLDQELFSIHQGIPTSEEVYTRVITDQYIAEYGYNTLSGGKIVEVTMDYSYPVAHWQPGSNGQPGEWIESIVSGQAVRQVPKYFSYHNVTHYYLYRIDQAKVENYALPSEIVLKPTGDYQVRGNLYKGGVHPPASHQTIHLGLVHSTPDFDAIAANSSQGYRVIDDLIKLNDQLITAGTKLPAPGKIGERVLYQEGIVIENKSNKADTPSQATVDYVPEVNYTNQATADIDLTGKTMDEVEADLALIRQAHSQPVDIVNGAGQAVYQVVVEGNPVTVHTPVVSQPMITNVSKQSQLVDQEPDRLQLVVGESFELVYPSTGDHRDIQGYGQNNYHKYIQIKQIRLPFDVYVGDFYNRKYYEQGSWINMTAEAKINQEQNGDFETSTDETPADQEQTDEGETRLQLFIPSWATEGSGEIEFRSIPINIEAAIKEWYPTFHMEALPAHPSPTNHSYQAELHYPAQMTELNETQANREVAHHLAINTIAYQLSGKMYKFGVYYCGDDDWNQYYQKQRITKIDGQSEQSAAVLPLMPGKKNPVDNKTLTGVRLGSAIHYQLNTNGDQYQADDMVIVDPQYSYVPIENGRANMAKRQAVDLYVNRQNRLERYDGIGVLTNRNRSLVGDSSYKPAHISSDRKQQSIQQWKGKFHLPNMTVAVPAGTNLRTPSKLDLTKEPFLRNGYIVVNFRIYHSSGAKNLSWEIYKDDAKLRAYVSRQAKHLDYGQGFVEEGYDTDQLTHRLQAGDMIFYSTEHRAGNTYQ